MTAVDKLAPGDVGSLKGASTKSEKSAKTEDPGSSSSKSRGAKESRGDESFLMEKCKLCFSTSIGVEYWS